MSQRAWFMDPGKQAGACLDKVRQDAAFVGPRSISHAQRTREAGGALGWPSLW
jgi:hypothetical protein